MMTPDEMIDVIQAWKCEKRIQARAHVGQRDHEKRWVSVEPNWDFYRCDFRIAPEPREFVIIIDRPIHGLAYFAAKANDREAVKWIKENSPTGDLVRVRETVD